MREILFRGKKESTGDWVFGDLRHYRSGKVGIHSDILRYTLLVDPETVGQYTGLRDGKRTEEYPDGQMIFEGDILKVKSRWKAEFNDEGGYEKKQTYWSVEHKNYTAEMGFFTFGIDRRWHKPLTWSRMCNAEAEVVGNIHDNPELLKEGGEE